jgi:hypothetical protein
VTGRAGCIEHAAIANPIINDAIEKKKQLYILSLYLRDTFESIPHDLILQNLTSIGTAEQLTKLIMNSYKEVTIQIQTKQGFTDRITIGKGVKQECPMSPSLFNLGIDPFIRNIRENYQECRYNYDRQLRKVIQAHPDDLLVFADTREHLNIFVDELEDFVKYAHINFNLTKCKLLVHNQEKELIIKVQLPNEKGELQDVGICGIKKTVKYFGIPLGTRKLPKSNSS